MTVNYTTNLALGQPVTGTESGTWGDDVNNSVTSYLDIAISGSLALTSASFTANALTLANTQGTSSATNIGSTTAQYYALRVSSLAANVTITAPSLSKTYLVVNSDSTYSVTVKASGQSGVAVVAGEKAVVYFNGTDYIKATSTVITNLTGTLPVANGGTGLTAFTANGMMYASSTSALATSADVTLPSTGVLTTMSAARTGAALSTTAPAAYRVGANTYTDNTTAASGTVAHGTIESIGIAPIAATNASVTYTVASSLYIDGPPSAGTNVTISRRYGLYSNTATNFMSKSGNGSAGQFTVTALQIAANNSVGHLAQIGFGQIGATNLYQPVAVGAIVDSTTASGTSRFFIATRSDTTDTSPATRVNIDSGGTITLGGYPSVPSTTYAVLNSTAGAIVNVLANTTTDSTSAASTTISTGYINYVGAQTLTSTNAITVTTLTNLFIGNTTAGANVTNTYKYALQLGGHFSATGYSANTVNTFGFKNRLINSTFLIQQYNPTIPSITAATGTIGAYVVDRWFAFVAGTSQTINITRSSNTSSSLYPYYMTATSTTASATIGFGQRIEQLYIADIGNASDGKITISGYIATSDSTTVTWELWTPSTADTWTSVATNGGVFDTGNSASVASGTLATGNLLATGGFVIQTAVTGANAQKGLQLTFKKTVTGVGQSLSISGVQLEKGGIATSFDMRSVQQEQLLCYRYLFSVAAGGQGSPYSLGYVTSATNFTTNTQFAIPLRVQPSAITTVGTLSNFQVRTQSSSFTVTAVTFGVANTFQATTNWTVASGLTAGNAGTIGQAGLSVGNYFYWSAEL